MANIFVSHRDSDAQKAKDLSEELRAAGHNVWLDVWKIKLGDSIVARINEGLQEAAYLILCYSASGSSDWVDREWMSALSRQLNGCGVKILPVLLSGGQSPAILADIKYANLTKDWAQGVTEILETLK